MVWLSCQPAHACLSKDPEGCLSYTIHFIHLRQVGNGYDGTLK